MDPNDPSKVLVQGINDWLETKVVHLRVLNEKIDSSKFDKGIVRQNEIWMPAMRMRPGLYHDAGYRFRENTINLKDSWLPGS